MATKNGNGQGKREIEETEIIIEDAQGEHIEDVRDMSPVGLIDAFNEQIGFVHGVVGFTRDVVNSDDCDLPYPAGWVVSEALKRIGILKLIADEMAGRLGVKCGSNKEKVEGA